MTDRKIRSVFPLICGLLCIAISLMGSAYATEEPVRDNYLDCPYNDEYTEQSAPDAPLESAGEVTLSAAAQQPVVTRPYYASSGTDINTPAQLPARAVPRPTQARLLP